MSLTPPPLRSGSVPATTSATAAVGGGAGGERGRPPHTPQRERGEPFGFGTQTTNLGQPLPPHPPAGTAALHGPWLSGEYWRWGAWRAVALPLWATPSVPRRLPLVRAR